MKIESCNYNIFFILAVMCPSTWSLCFCVKPKPLDNDWFITNSEENTL